MPWVFAEHIPTCTKAVPSPLYIWKLQSLDEFVAMLVRSLMSGINVLGLLFVFVFRCLLLFGHKQ